MSPLPRFVRVRQNFPQPPAFDWAHALATEFAKIQPRLTPGASVAIGVGSRGIANLLPIVTRLVELLKAAGTRPFIFPAMGSHGGATPEGQRELLADYGISEATMGVPVRAAMETEIVGHTALRIFS